MPYSHPDWFSIHIPVWEQKLAHLRDKYFRYLEIGSFEGRSLVWVLENFPKCEAVVFDTFEGNEEHAGYDMEKVLANYLHNIRPYKHRVETHIGDSCTQLAHLITQAREFDVIYVDGDHRAESALTDAVMAWRVLSKGGIMIFDDYAWELGDGPRRAVDAFLSIFTPRVIHKERQVFLEKTSECTGKETR